MIVRRVGFRDGSDEELSALHAVETPVAAERGSRRMPQQVGDYITYARNLPSQFNDHAWLAETGTGEPSACGYCWHNAAAADRAMECDVLVRKDHRRRGIGSRLLREICTVALDEGHPLLTWSTFDAVPAGEAFSRRVGAVVGRVNRTSELPLADVDWSLVAEWARAARPRQRGYRLEFVDGAYPDPVRSDAVVFHRIMQSAPRDNLDRGDVNVDADFVAELDRAMQDAHQERWSILVRDDAGNCLGGTEVIVEPSDPSVVFQQNTGIDVAHRGLGLAKWVKGAMLERIRSERPDAARIRTDNAFSNAPMIAINTALGFRVVSSRTEWQGEAADVFQALR